MHASDFPYIHSQRQSQWIWQDLQSLQRQSQPLRTGYCTE
nr:MAG TPA: hypothetical protein [Caudoviricetes sp.]